MIDGSLLAAAPALELDARGELVEAATGRRFAGDAVADALLGRHPEGPARGTVPLGPRAAAALVDPEPAAAELLADLDAPSGRVTLTPRFQGAAAAFTLEELEHLPWDRRYYRRGDRFQRIDRGLVARARQEARRLGGVDDGRAFLFPAARAREVLEAFAAVGAIRETEAFASFRKAILEFTSIVRVELPESLREGVQLREYQRHGLDWLWFLFARGFGGILADDMGLGKTIQTLALLARAREVEGKKVSLVLCPASLLGHWQKDAARFFSGLTVARAQGSRRHTLYDQSFLDANIDVLVLSYETARGDAGQLKGLSFRLAVLDEAQRFKNPGTRLHAALRGLNARCRIALSGTPVETRLRDLWGISSVVLPGYLGSEAHFEATYEIPRNTSALAERMKPFLLHRRKTTPEIAAELPPKILMPSRECTMTSEQRRLYDEFVEAAKPEIRRAVAAETFRITPNVLETVTRLKQICGHPALLGKEGPGSGKLDELLSLLEELLEDLDNRVLVFSQYATMVDLLAGSLRKQGISPLVLTGADGTAEREASVAAFNAPESTRRVFLLSLRAGGVGLNLQAANHVIHYDRWWNPAVERQAEDRAYRLGQRKTVVVHRFLTVGSIEERIEEILAEREDLIGDVLDEQEAIRKTLTREDLIAIFGLGEPDGRVSPPAAR